MRVVPAWICPVSIARAATGLAALFAPTVACARTAVRCPGTTVDAREGPAMARWTPSVTVLRAALTVSGHPWSCTPARVLVEPMGSSLRVDLVMPDGRRATRRVDTPEELQPTVEAVLVAGDPPSTPFPAPVPAPVPAPPRHRHPVFPVPTVSPGLTATYPPSLLQSPLLVHTADESVPGDPAVSWGHFLAGMEGGLRIAGPSAAVMLSLGVYGGVCLGHGCFTLWGRYDAVVAGLDAAPGDLDVAVLTGGVSAAWAWALGQGRVEAGPTLALAGVVESLESVRSQRGSTAVQPRLGAVIRWRARAQGVGLTVSLDADGAPGSPGGPVVPRLPGPPAWSVGASAGVSFGGPR